MHNGLAHGSNINIAEKHAQADTNFSQLHGLHMLLFSQEDFAEMTPLVLD